MIHPLSRAIVEAPVWRSNRTGSGTRAWPGGGAHSPVELVEIILCHQPEIDPHQKKKEGHAQEEEPRALPL